MILSVAGVAEGSPFLVLASSHAGRCVTSYAQLQKVMKPCSLQMAKAKKGASYVADLQASLHQHRNEIVLLLNRCGSIFTCSLLAAVQMRIRWITLFFVFIYSLTSQHFSGLFAFAREQPALLEDPVHWHRALIAGKDKPILLPHVLRDLLEEIAVELNSPSLRDSAFSKHLAMCQEVALQSGHSLI